VERIHILESANQVDRPVRAPDRMGDAIAIAHVHGHEPDLPDLPQRLDRVGRTDVALGDKDARASLEQRFAYMAADESAAAEDGDERWSIGIGHGSVRLRFERAVIAARCAARQAG
jgi:hypothetical protein